MRAPGTAIHGRVHGSNKQRGKALSDAGAYEQAGPSHHTASPGLRPHTRIRGHPHARVHPLTAHPLTAHVASKICAAHLLLLRVCVQGPFTYEALPPEDIKFVPLKQTQEFKANDLMQVGGQGQGGGWRVRCVARPSPASRLGC